MDWVISGGRILRDGILAEDDLALCNGVVADRPAPSAARLDAHGLLVLPGLIDIHGDAHERQLQPRPGVIFPAGLALRDSAAQIVSSGITTAYLGVTLSWEPGLRSLAVWQSLKSALAEERQRSACDLRIHLRFEADNLDAMDDALSSIADGSVHLLGFNDHTPAILERLPDPKQAAKYAARAGVPEAEYRALAERAAARRPEVPAAQERLAAAARSAGVPMLSHDDATSAQRALFRALGVLICEFPMAESVAEDARAAGEAVVMGAPNVVRGGSHLGWASAAPLAERGVVTILASDYYWPALLEAVFVLVQRGILDLPSAWALVSANPADALGLADRGRIAPGLRGDVIVVDPTIPGLVATFVAGRLAWLAPVGAERLR